MRLWLALAVAVRGADLIVRQPSSGGVEKVLVVVNGAFIENGAYESVALAIQAEAFASYNVSLWIAIPTFPLDCPNPANIGSKIGGAVDAVRDAGFEGLVPSVDVWVAGHSLGGIFSQWVVNKGGYAGLVLLGSYLTTTYGFSLADFRFPTLTLCGELDGLTRVTRLARELDGMRARVASEGRDARYSFPVCVLAGQSHSQFCEGVNVTSFGTKDLLPSVSWPRARAAIAEQVAAFLAQHSSAVDDDAQTRARQALDRGVAFAEQLLAPFQAALLSEAGADSVCAAAQSAAAANVTAFRVRADRPSSLIGFELADVSTDAAKRTVTVVDYPRPPLNPTDSSLTAVAVGEVDCKWTPEKMLAKTLGQTASTSLTSADCAAANLAALAAARAALPAEALARYDARGKTFALLADEICSTGAAWTLASFELDTDDSSVNVKSPRLATDDHVLCKLLAPSKVIEYMMVDGLPRFDGTVN